MERNDIGPLNLYKKTIFCTKLVESLNELKQQSLITPSLETKIMAKFDEIMCEEILKNLKNKNIIKGKVASFRNCDDIWIFYCKNVNIKLEKSRLTFPKLKIIALHEDKLKKKNKNENKYSLNQVAENI